MTDNFLNLSSDLNSPSLRKRGDSQSFANYSIAGKEIYIHNFPKNIKGHSPTLGDELIGGYRLDHDINKGSSWFHHVRKAVSFAIGYRERKFTENMLKQKFIREQQAKIVW